MAQMLVDGDMSPVKRKPEKSIEDTGDIEMGEKLPHCPPSVEEPMLPPANVYMPQNTVDQPKPPLQKKDVFINASIVIDDISIPDTTFTVHGYIEAWWVKSPEFKGITFPVKEWKPKKVWEWYNEKVEAYLDECWHGSIKMESMMKEQMLLFSEKIIPYKISGDALIDFDEHDLDELGIELPRARDRIMRFRNELLETQKEYEESHLDKLKAPLNWAQLFFNSISEEIVSVNHKFLKNPVTGKLDVVKGIYQIEAVLSE